MFLRVLLDHKSVGANGHIEEEFELAVHIIWWEDCWSSCHRHVKVCVKMLLYLLLDMLKIMESSDVPRGFQWNTTLQLSISLAVTFVGFGSQFFQLQ